MLHSANAHHYAYRTGTVANVRIKFWGVRGSIPAPLSSEQLNEKLLQALSGAKDVNLSDLAEVQAYIASLPPSVRRVVGGNTTCVEVDTGTDTIIIDCGSGMRAFGISLMAREFGRGQGVAHIFLTHAHWDHLQGYPFFAPAYVPGNKLIFYAVNQNPQRYLEHQQVAPTYFPIPPNAMPADKQFIQLREGENVQIGRTLVSNLALYHPGTAYAYRFDDGESVFVFASDGEYKSLAEASLRRYIDFFANADVLVFDAQYSLRDVFLSKADWGHSSAIIGVDIAERAGVKQLITFHHDPTHSDEQIYAIAAAAREYALVNQIHPNTEVIVGTEGLELFLGQPLGLEALEERTDSVWTLALAGQLNAATAAEAQQHLRTMLTESPQGRVLLDLTLIDMADAIGVKCLLDTSRQHPTANLAVLAPTPNVRRALDQSGAEEVLKIFRHRNQALAALTGPAHLRLASETIGGQYQINEMLFVDELGVVYQGIDLRDGTPVVVRVVAGKPDDPFRIEFNLQIQVWRMLHHPGLLPGKAVITQDDWVAFVCPRPTGTSLREWRAKKPLWLDIWRTAEQLCQAVATMHERGVTHGDIRPENILVSGAQAQIARAPIFTHPPEYGPSAYHAPEQIRGKVITQRTDVYSLGIILYELFLGAHPFAAESEELRLTLQLYSQPQSPRLRWPEIPLALESLLMKMLALAPEDRFASGQEVLEAYLELQRRFARANEG
jgi:anti-anti-sigma factor